MVHSCDPTSPPFTISNLTEPTAAILGSLTRRRFFGARAAGVASGTPRRTRDADKEEQRDEFHIHIAKLIIWRLQYISNMGNRKTYLRLECESCRLYASEI